METILISALAAACILAAIEAFAISLGKWRGLLATVLNLIFCLILGTGMRYLIPYVLSSTFVGLSLSLLVESIFVGTPKGDLPKRIPPR